MTRRRNPGGPRSAVAETRTRRRTQRSASLQVAETRTRGGGATESLFLPLVDSSVAGLPLGARRVLRLLSLESLCIARGGVKHDPENRLSAA
jgi:hypothetical protein